MPLKFFQMSMVTQVLISLAAGIVCGLFFGEETGRIGVLGDIYIALLQMTVLPYLVVALVGSIARLDPTWAAQIGARGAALMVALWAVSFLVVLAIPLAYPDWPDSSAFSSIQEPLDRQIDMLSIFVPSNIFRSLSQNFVPAVVFFCILLGIALMRVEQKDRIIDDLSGLLAAITKMTMLALRLAPIGIFAIAAEAAGEIELEQFQRLQIHIITISFAWALMHFAVFPVILAASTPVAYWRFLQATHVAAVTAFATNSTLVVLPIMIASCKEVLEECDARGDESAASVDVLIPTAYSLPNAGTVLNLGFVLFAAWFVGSELTSAQNAEFVFAGGLFSVAGMVVAIPMMLDQFQLPADLFQLHVLAGVFTVRLATALGVVFGMVLSLLVSFSMAGRFNRRRFLIAAAASIAVCVVALSSFSLLLGGTAPVPFDGEQRHQTARAMMDPVSSRMVPDPAPLSAEDRARSRLEVIRERGIIRVGFRAEALPYSFVNQRGEIVGFDVERVNALARGMGVAIEFTDITGKELKELLGTARLDLVAGAIAITPERATFGAFTNSYFEESVGFVVRDHRRADFVDMEVIRQMESLTLAVPKRYRPPILELLLPNATFVPIDVPGDYVRGKFPKIDGMLFGAQTAFVHTLSYPDYSITIPRGMKMKVPLAFLLPLDAPVLLNFVNTWLALNRDHGLVKHALNHWVLGAAFMDKSPRWSVIRDVLHWID